MFPSGPPKSGSLGSEVLVGVAVEVAAEADVAVAVAVEVNVCEGVAEVFTGDVAVPVKMDV